MEGNVFVSFMDDDQPTYGDLVEPTLAVCSTHGLCESGADEPIDPDEISIGDRNNLRLFWDYRDVRFRFGIDDWQEPFDQVLSVRTSANDFPPDEDDPADEYTGVARKFVDLIRDLAIELDPVYVAAFNTRHGSDGTPSPEKVLALDAPVEDQLDRIPWLGIYSEPLIGAFGGRERVLNAPGWNVEELPTGSILIITTRQPWEGYHSKLPPDKYLLDGEDLDDATEDDEPTVYSDPFAALEPGEYGADVGVHPDDIAEKFENEDLQLVRVYVDEERNLRRVADDSFVRNVVEESGRNPSVFQEMLAHVPSGVRNEQVLVSALVPETIPPAFVRLDEPDGENVVTKVMDLDTDVSKYDMLIRLGDAARHEGSSQEVLQTMETALDKIADLDEVEGLDKWIEDFFF